MNDAQFAVGRYLTKEWGFSNIYRNPPEVHRESASTYIDVRLDDERLRITVDIDAFNPHPRYFPKEEIIEYADPQLFEKLDKMLKGLR